MEKREQSKLKDGGPSAGGEASNSDGVDQAGKRLTCYQPMDLTPLKKHCVKRFFLSAFLHLGAP